MAALAVVAAAVSGCGSVPEQGLFPWCSPTTPPDPAPVAAPLTYHADIRPLVDRKCARCHGAEGIAPFALDSAQALVGRQAAVAHAVRTKAMPPWLGASCCAGYRDDWSLAEDERSKLLAWLAQGAAEGDPATATPSTPVGGLSRVDLVLTMPEPYRPEPPRAGATDDNRCFVLEWPLQTESFVSGINVVPGNRALVHHLTVAVVSGDDVDDVRALDARDPRLGFNCPGGFGAVRVTAVLGGAGASEFPEGLAKQVPPRSALVLNVHYSIARGVSPSRPTDQTAVQIKLSPSGRSFRTLAVANPAWTVAGAMRVRAGDPDAVFYYRYRPSLFTRGKRIQVLASLPHMHAFGRGFLMGILRADGSKDCLLEIPRWHFGWAQPFWLSQPKTLGPDDQIYVECRFDNSDANQPVIDGRPRPPRDIAWGNEDQEMCVGFAYFLEEG
jgi:hypothetical protein